MALLGCLVVASCSNAGAERYPTHTVTATVYWAGEGATRANDKISNVPSAWSKNTIADFGCIDRPNGRTCTPRHNPFYAALPANEFEKRTKQNPDGLIEAARKASPWAKQQVGPKQSLFKGRWIAVTANGRTAYTQWHDAGPCSQGDRACERDYDYVFGTAKPVNRFGEKAGIDLSPDAAKYLRIGGSGKVSWRFVDESDVPSGPWKRYPAITNQTRF
jgi:hypothetical protein